MGGGGETLVKLPVSVMHKILCEECVCIHCDDNVAVQFRYIYMTQQMLKFDRYCSLDKQ